MVYLKHSSSRFNVQSSIFFCGNTKNNSPLSQTTFCIPFFITESLFLEVFSHSSWTLKPVHLPPLCLEFGLLFLLFHLDLSMYYEFLKSEAFTFNSEKSPGICSVNSVDFDLILGPILLVTPSSHSMSLLHVVIAHIGCIHQSFPRAWDGCLTPVSSHLNWFPPLCIHAAVLDFGKFWFLNYATNPWLCPCLKFSLFLSLVQLFNEALFTPFCDYPEGGALSSSGSLCELTVESELFHLSTPGTS